MNDLEVEYLIGLDIYILEYLLFLGLVVFLNSYVDGVVLLNFELLVILLGEWVVVFKGSLFLFFDWVFNIGLKWVD